MELTDGALQIESDILVYIHTNVLTAIQKFVLLHNYCKSNNCYYNNNYVLLWFHKHVEQQESIRGLPNRLLQVFIADAVCRR